MDRILKQTKEGGLTDSSMTITSFEATMGTGGS